MLYLILSGQSMINQYGQVDTVKDLGSMDSAVMVVKQFLDSSQLRVNLTIIT